MHNYIAVCMIMYIITIRRNSFIGHLLHCSGWCIIVTKGKVEGEVKSNRRTQAQFIFCYTGRRP